MIKIENVTKSYVKGKKSVDNLNLEIKDGEIFGFLGPNGAGKTTTIKMITGILNPDEGDILIDGKFELDKRDIMLKYRGSANQRVIDVKKSLEEGKIIEIL